MNAERRTVLVISHICPEPPTHGVRRRVGQLLGWLKKEGYRVVYVMQPEDVESFAALKKLKSQVDELVVVPRRQGLARALWILRSIALAPFKILIPSELRKKLRGRSEPQAPQETEALLQFQDIDKLCWPTTVNVVHRMVELHQPVAVISQFIHFSRCLEGLPSACLKIVDTHEVYHRNQQMFLREKIHSAFTCTAEDERRGLLRADVILGIQENDSASLQALVPERTVRTVGYASPEKKARERRPAAGRVLYVGSTNHFNRHGLEGCLEKAWPAVRASCPDAELRIVGTFPDLKKLGLEGVTFLGRVSEEQLDAEYDAAWAVINPQVAGNGLKIKCVEAMANGCALLVHPAGADGLEDGAGRAFVLVKDWPGFASELVDLLKNPERRKTLERGAREYIAQRFSEAVIFAPLKEVLQGPLASRHRKQA